MCATRPRRCRRRGHPPRPGRLARRHAGDDLGPGGQHALRVERALAAGDALHEHADGVIDEDGHQRSRRPRSGAAAGAAARRSSPRRAMSTTAGRPRPGSQRDRELGQAGGLEHVAALLGGVAVQAHDDGHVDAAPPDHLDEAPATSSQRVMPPKMLTSTAATAARRHRLEGGLRDLGAGAAADVAEVGGAAAGGGDLVDDAHHQAGAVADDADVAVQRDEREARRAGLGLAFVLGRLAASCRLPVERVVVDGHLAVQAHELAARGERRAGSPRPAWRRGRGTASTAPRQTAASALPAPRAARVCRGAERGRLHDVAHLVLAAGRAAGRWGGARSAVGRARRELLDVHAALTRRR